MQNKKHKLSNGAGFTLVEMILVIAIIGIIAAVSWATLGQAKKTADVQNACEQVASMINKTRNYALSGRLSPATVKIDGGRVTIYSNPNEIFNILSGVSCGDHTIIYEAPSAMGDFAGNIICSGGGASRTITVPHYGVAVCN